MVRSRRLELPRGRPHSDLNAARLPIPPRPHVGDALDCAPQGGGGIANRDGAFKTGGMAHRRPAGRLRGGGRSHGGTGPRHPAGRVAGPRLAAGASGALHSRRLRRPDRTALAGPLSRVRDRARRALHLSRPGTADRLRHARPPGPRARRARLCARPRGMADPDGGAVRPGRRAGGGGASASGSGAADGSARSPRSACACAAGSRFTASP